MKHVPSIVLLSLCALGAAHAQAIYKYRMPDGRIVYTSENLPNAKLLGTVREPPAAQPIDEKRQAEMRREKDTATQALARRSEAIASADAQVAVATRALEAAKARRAAGAEMEEGDRVGGRAGTRAAYAERQADLQAAVDAAQRQLDRAYEARNAAR